jgi:hypothetical protein
MVGATQQSDALFRSMSSYVDPGWFCPFVGATREACCSNRLTCVNRCCNWLNLTNMSLACCESQTTCSGKTCSVESGNLRSAINVATFSALGPTADGRFKPDLVTTGEDTLSAATPSQTTLATPFRYTEPNHCINPGGSKTARSPADDFNKALDIKSGTSMSTPLMAGGAEKIRQYFVQGYYPLGTARSSAGFNPDSALVRAVILASCKPLAGIGGVWKNSREGAANYPYATAPFF